MYGLVLIITISITGGFIAYFGDNVGRKIGRKKLSIAGLRPKHTGILISIVTGTLVSLSSIIILMIVSQDVRVALFEMHDLQEALTNSKAALEGSLWETQQAIEHTERLKVEKATLEEDVEHLNVQIEGAKEVVASYHSLAIELDHYTRILQETSFSFLANEIIHAFILTAGMSTPDLQQEFAHQVLQANAMALARGADTVGGNGLAVVPGTGELDQVIKMIAEYLTERDGAHIIRITNMYNSPRGVPVQFFFDIFPNEQVFYRGEILAKIVVSSHHISDPYTAVFELLNSANALALQRGMMTESGTDAIELPGDDFFGIIDFINQKGRGMIQLVSEVDAWRVDNPVQLRVRVHTDHDNSAKEPPL